MEATSRPRMLSERQNAGHQISFSSLRRRASRRPESASSSHSMISHCLSLTGTKRSVTWTLRSSSARSIPRSPAVQTVGWLAPGGHDAPERRVPGLPQLVAHRDQRGHVRLHHLVPAAQHPLRRHDPAVDLNLLGDGDARQAEKLGNAQGHLRVVPVRRLPAAYHEVEPVNLLDGLRQGEGRTVGVQIFESLVL